MIVELIIHYKYNSSKTVRGKIKIRKDYDIALIRLDYPIIDEESGECVFILISIVKNIIIYIIGMSVIKENKFSKKSIMPICLPSSEQFPDINRPATAVGMGITSERLQGN